MGTGLTAIGFATPVQAAEWVKVTENAAKDSFFIDSSTIKKTGNLVTYWEYREFVTRFPVFLMVLLSMKKLSFAAFSVTLTHSAA